jgi:hypothetical protein
MPATLQVKVSPEEMIEAVKKMKKKERDAFVEDLLAATSPAYLKSIRDARADYKAKRTKSHDEVFGG